jgi:hypothetical protein
VNGQITVFAVKPDQSCHLINKSIAVLVADIETDIGRHPDVVVDAEVVVAPLPAG